MLISTVSSKQIQDWLTNRRVSGRTQNNYRRLISTLFKKELASPPDYETKSEVARRLHASQRTIDNRMKQRRLPFIKLTSKIVRFPKAEVDAYLTRKFLIEASGPEWHEQG